MDTRCHVEDLPRAMAKEIQENLCYQYNLMTIFSTYKVFKILATLKRKSERGSNPLYNAVIQFYQI